MSGAYSFDNLADHAEALNQEVGGEGELPVDIAETDEKLIITAPVAGVQPEHLSIFLDGDIVTIRGQRERDLNLATEHFFSEECFWGNFSRSIILPVDVRSEEAVATFKNGMLTIVFPKEVRARHIPIVIIDEE